MAHIIIYNNIPGNPAENIIRAAYPTLTSEGSIPKYPASQLLQRRPEASV